MYIYIYLFSSHFLDLACDTLSSMRSRCGVLRDRAIDPQKVALVSRTRFATVHRKTPASDSGHPGRNTRRMGKLEEKSRDRPTEKLRARREERDEKKKEEEEEEEGPRERRKMMQIDEETNLGSSSEAKKRVANVLTVCPPLCIYIYGYANILYIYVHTHICVYVCVRGMCVCNTRACVE